MGDFWRLDNLERITGGQWLRAPGDLSTTAAGLSHDTRTLTPGQVYLAVKGENHDGHRFVGPALEAGAALAVVSDEHAPGLENLPGAGAVLRVDDTVAALQDLASAYRDELAKGGCKVVAVCGSNGKTTTRHLLHHVLTSCGLTGTQSPKSFNNHLGVPLTLLAARPDHDFVACEIGTNHPGEIAALGEIAWPDAAVITSIGKEHLEFFKNLEGVAKEEASIMRFVRPNGLVALPADAAEKVMPYYDVQDGVVFLPVAPGSVGRDVPDEFPLLGEHNRTNAALAVAVARWLGCEADAIAAAWADVEAPPGRLRRVTLGQGVTIIDDSYNANPDSMRLALHILSQAQGRTVAILGEMLELGETSEQEHAAVADLTLELEIDYVASIGSAATKSIFGKRYIASRPRMRLPSVEAALESEGFLDIFSPGDTILLKGSRGMALERMIPAIEAKFGKADP